EMRLARTQEAQVALAAASEHLAKAKQVVKRAVVAEAEAVEQVDPWPAFVEHVNEKARVEAKRSHPAGIKLSAGRVAEPVEWRGST
ncbi:hypothetical protein LCGC14_1860220, partial [marine sediment metagenome]